MPNTKVVYTPSELATIGRLVSKRSPAKQAVMRLAESESMLDVQEAVRMTSDWHRSLKAIKALRKAKAAKIETVIRLSQARTASEILDLVEEGKSRQKSVMTELNSAMTVSFLS